MSGNFFVAIPRNKFFLFCGNTILVIAELVSERWKISTSQKVVTTIARTWIVFLKKIEMSIENFLDLQIEPDKSTPEFPRVLFVELGPQLGDLD